MANNYQQWSEILPFNQEGSIKAQKKWVKDVLSLEVEPGAEADMQKKLESFGIVLEKDQAEYWPNFEWSVLDDEKGVWVYAPESGGIEEVCEFVQAFLKLFNPTGFWELTWAESCSKMRIGQFSGGAVFVTATTIDFHSVSEWIYRKGTEHAKVVAHAGDLEKAKKKRGAQHVAPSRKKKARLCSRL